jgi:hypothetical protein
MLDGSGGLHEYLTGQQPKTQHADPAHGGQNKSDIGYNRFTLTATARYAMRATTSRRLFDGQIVI